MLENFGNPNWIVPTPPAGDSSNRVADTEFVTNAIASAGSGISTSVLASALATTLASAYAGTTGFVLQTVYNSTSAYIASNTAMAGNFTSIPIKTDGIQIITATITPAATANKLLIQAVIPASHSATNGIIAALLQDTTTNALAANWIAMPQNTLGNLIVNYSTAAGTTGPTVFKINVMNFSAVAVTWAVNGQANGTTLLGGTVRSSLTIQETKG